VTQAEDNPRQQRTAAPEVFGLNSQQVQLLQDYLIRHLADSVKIGDLARLVGLSPFHFCRKFKAALGCSPRQHLMSLRLREARRLLGEASPTITTIAFTVGYNSSQAFARVFNRKVGVSPRDYRAAVCSQGEERRRNPVSNMVARCFDGTAS